MKHHRNNDEVYQSEERPDGAEDEEVDLRGRVGIAVVVVIPPVCNCERLLARRSHGELQG